MTDARKVAQFWDTVARHTTLADKTAVGMLTDGNEYNAIYRRREEEAHFLRIVKLEKSMNVLEVGSGGGRWAFFLCDKVSSVVGIDFSKNMIEIANLHLKKNRINNVRFVQTELLSFDESEKFDIIYFSGVLQYITDDDALASIKKARSMLRTNGIVISRDTTQQFKRLTMNGTYPVIYRTVDEYKSMFGRAGLLLDYCEPSYSLRRFAHFASFISRLPFVGYRTAHKIHKGLIRVNTLLGNPRIFMRRHHRAMIDSVGEREHRFFKYRPDET